MLKVLLVISFCYLVCSLEFCAYHAPLKLLTDDFERAKLSMRFALQKSFFLKIKSMKQIDIWSTFLSVSLEKSQMIFSETFSDILEVPISVVLQKFSWFKSCQSQFSPLFPPIIERSFMCAETIITETAACGRAFLKEEGHVELISVFSTSWLFNYFLNGFWFLSLLFCWG